MVWNWYFTSGYSTPNYIVSSYVIITVEIMKIKKSDRDQVNINVYILKQFKTMKTEFKSFSYSYEIETIMKTKWAIFKVDVNQLS